MHGMDLASGINVNYLNDSTPQVQDLIPDTQTMHQDPQATQWIPSMELCEGRLDPDTESGEQPGERLTSTSMIQ